MEITQVVQAKLATKGKPRTAVPNVYLAAAWTVTDTKRSYTDPNVDLDAAPRSNVTNGAA